MGKVEIGIYFCLTEDILTKVLLKCSLSSSLPTICILSKPLILISCHDNQKAELKKIYTKNFFSEAIREMKLKLYRNVHDIGLYRKYVFYCHCLCALLAFFSLTAEFDKRFLTLSPYTKMLCKLLILICCHFNVNAKMLN